ncbi:MAG TPA: DinB family protein [Gemmatimonadaceae bacterium]|nr:DinB family protein [Gemmatimonadaceae bacterium]
MYSDFENEHAATRRMLERFPDAHRDWRPHEHSRTIAELATHVADIPDRAVSILTTDSMEAGARKPRSPVGTAAELLALHDTSVAAQKRALAESDLEALSKDWTIRSGEKVIIRAPKYQMLRTVMMSHLIHHRAQLSVYYRMLGVPVPGMYGPSADDLAGRK